MLMPRGLPVPTYVQPYRKHSALEAVISPNSSVVGEPINLGYLSPMRSPGNMMGKHLLNDRSFPNALAGEYDGEAPTK